MATKPEVIPMQVTELGAVGEVLSIEKGYCEICGDELALWPPDLITAHAYEKHSAVMWPALREKYEQFLAEPDSLKKQVALNQGRAEYLVKILGSRFDLYQKLVDAGAIVAPKKG